MTCIVGIQMSDGVMIGADSGGSSDLVIVHRGDPKVFANGPYLIGFTSSYRMGQLIQYSDLPKPLDRSGAELDRFMVTEFVDGIRSILKAGGFAKKDEEREEGGTFLIGVSGRLYQVEGDYQVGWSTDGYDACGSGWEIAFGALHATRKLEPETRMYLALAAASHHSGVVNEPFIVMTMKNNLISRHVYPHN